MQRIRVLLWTLVALGVLAGVYLAARRFAVESANRAVELALDMTEVQKLAAAEGRSLEATLKTLKDAGATSVAISEDTIGSLEENRKVEVVSTGRKYVTYLMVHQGNYRRVAEALRHRTHFTLSQPPSLNNATTSPMDAGMDIYQPYSLLHTVGVGLDPDLVTAARTAGLGVIARPVNTENISAKGIDWVCQQLAEQKAHGVLFAGDEVLGFRGQLRATADALRNHGLYYGTIEFGKQKGDPQLQKLAPERTVRVHTVTGAEMVTATMPENLQRFSLAARERNIRLLFVRLFLDESGPEAADSPLSRNADYIQRLHTALQRGRLVPQAAHGYGALSSPVLLRLVLGVGIGAAGLLVVLSICPMERSLHHPLFYAAATIAVALALLACAGMTGAKLAALAAACLFPTLALIRIDLLAPLAENPSRRRVLLERLLLCSLTTALGIPFLVGLLADQLFLIKADGFVGIKAMLYVPPLIAALVYGLELRAPTPRELAERCRAVGRSLLGLAQNPVLIWQIVAAGLVLVILALLWLRSGNEGNMVVSDSELRFRGLLDQWLPARPRTKEFAFGHPGMVLALGLALRGQRRWALPLLLVGAIGQTSLLNTFCHLHTPLLVSVTRAVLGLVIGGAIGLVLLELPTLWSRWKSRTA